MHAGRCFMHGAEVVTVTDLEVCKGCHLGSGIDSICKFKASYFGWVFTWWHVCQSPHVFALWKTMLIQLARIYLLLFYSNFLISTTCIHMPHHSNVMHVFYYISISFCGWAFKFLSHAINYLFNLADSSTNKVSNFASSSF